MAEAAIPSDFVRLQVARVALQPLNCSSGDMCDDCLASLTEEVLHPCAVRTSSMLQSFT